MVHPLHQSSLGQASLGQSSLGQSSLGQSFLRQHQYVSMLKPLTYGCIAGLLLLVMPLSPGLTQTGETQTGETQAGEIQTGQTQGTQIEAGQNGDLVDRPVSPSRLAPTAPGGSSLRLAPNTSNPLLTAPFTSSPVPDPGYLVGAGDVLVIDIFDVPEYSGQYGVLSDGSVRLPLVGTIPLAGTTLDQASQRISQKLSPMLRRPIVTVTLAQPRPVQVAIAGQVKHPGVYTLETFTALTQALQQAGGTTAGADLRQVEVRRPLPFGQGEEQRLTFNLLELINAGDLNQDLTLRDGDSIFVPTATTINPQESQRIALSTFATNSQIPIQIAVVGEVRTPGPHTLAAGTLQTVTTAIQGAGGITQQADIRKIEIRRTDPYGKAQTIAVDFWKLLKEGDLTQDLPLQNGDAIVIPTASNLSAEELTYLAAASFSPETIRVNIVGEVAGPGSLEVPPNTPLNQAILAAGGFTNRANKGTVELVRLNPNGTVAQRSIEIDLAQSLNPDSNPALIQGDTVIVGRSGFTVFQDTLGNILSPFTAGFSLFRLLGL